MSIYKKSVALFLGSFNPIHVGHLFIANKALEQTDLDEVWFVVSPQSPDKVGDEDLLNVEDRIKMVEWSIIHSPNMHVSDIETTLPQPNYTINTVKALEEKYPDYTFSIIMGSDNLKNIDRWTNFREVAENYRFIVFDRPGYEAKDERFNIHYMDAPRMEISASYLRDELKAGRDIRYLVPNGVIAYIKKENIYV